MGGGGCGEGIERLRESERGRDTTRDGGGREVEGVGERPRERGDRKT